MSLSLPELARQLRELQEAGDLVAVTAIADTPKGLVKVTVLRNTPAVAIEDERGSVIFPGDSDD